MNHTEILQRLAKIYGLGEARALMLLVLESRFGMSMTDVYCGKVSELSSDNQQELDKIIKRLENQEPVQYVLGEAAFYGRTFNVAPGVLIPRIETEEIIDEAKALIENEKMVHEGFRILDIGTGSGCIAVTMALECPDAYVEAWDISDEALSIAGQNNSKHSADVELRCVNILDNESVASLMNGRERFDVVISNPPYICHKEVADMERNVLDHEPHLALFVPDDDPLLFYRTIALQGKTILRDGGLLVFEINRAYGDETAEMLREFGYKEIRIKNDQFGNKRVISCFANQ